MFVFGIATIPALFILSYTISELKNLENIRTVMLKASSLLIMGFSYIHFTEDIIFYSFKMLMCLTVMVDTKIVLPILVIPTNKTRR